MQVIAVELPFLYSVTVTEELAASVDDVNVKPFTVPPAVTVVSHVPGLVPAASVVQLADRELYKMVPAEPKAALVVVLPV